MSQPCNLPQSEPSEESAWRAWGIGQPDSWGKDKDVDPAESMNTISHASHRTAAILNTAPEARGWRDTPRLPRFSEMSLSVALSITLALLLGMGPLNVLAQTGPSALSATAASPQDPEAAGSLAGQVADASGALIPGARVRFRATGKQRDRDTLANEEGSFAVRGVAAGEYTLLVTAPGFTDFRSLPFTLRAGEDRRLDPVTLAIPANHADAYVTLSRREIAGAELHAAEQQRIVGFPDFYTSFVWNAAPMDARQKLSLGLHATTDRMAFVTAGIVASGEQIKNTFPEFGGGAAGFGKRYGAAYADGFTGKIIGAALLPALFRQDPRYFYMGTNGTVKQRVRHAVLSAFLARGDNGRTELNYSHILGNASAGALSTLYHPAADSAGKLALDNALLGTLGEAGVNVVRELFLKRFVRGGDVDANGMP